MCPLHAYIILHNCIDIETSLPFLLIKFSYKYAYMNFLALSYKILFHLCLDKFSHTSAQTNVYFLFRTSTYIDPLGGERERERERGREGGSEGA